MNEVDAGVEKFRRDIRAKYKPVKFPDILEADDNSTETPMFLSRHQRNAIIREVEFMIGRLIQRKAEHHPTFGKTLT